MTKPLYVERAAREGDYLLLVFPRTGSAGRLAGRAAVLRVKRRMLLNIVYPVTLDAGKHVYGVLGTNALSVQAYGDDLVYTEDADTLFHVFPALRSKPDSVLMYIHYPYNAPPLNISDNIPAPSIPLSVEGTPSIRTKSGAYYSVASPEELDPKDPRIELIVPPYVHVGYTLVNIGSQPVDATLLLRVWRYEVRPATQDEAQRVANREIPPEFIHIYSVGGTGDWDVPANLVELYTKAGVPLLEL